MDTIYKVVTEAGIEEYSGSVVNVDGIEYGISRTVLEATVSELSSGMRFFACNPDISQDRIEDLILRHSTRSIRSAISIAKTQLASRGVSFPVNPKFLSHE